MARARKTCLIAALLMVATVAAFWPMTGNDFVFDDRGEFGGDERTASAWVIRSTEYSLYVPLARLSVWLDFRLFGNNPFGHHLTSLLLHGIDSALVFLAGAALTGALWRSAAVAALCAVHPLRVEPAAWISGRADLLAALFGLLALLAWVQYLRRRRALLALLATGMFLLGMLSKPIVMMLPFLLLVLDFWPLGRAGVPRAGGEPARVPGPGRRPGIAALLMEKAGLFLVAGVLTGVLLSVLEHGSLVVLEERYPLAARVVTSLSSYAFYIGKTLWPSGLTVFYPHRWGAVAWWEVAGAAALLAVVSTAAFRSARCRPYLLAGWLWFLGTLLPVIGLYQVRQYPVADRYGYLPQIGLFVMAVWRLEEFGRGRRGGRAASVAAVLALILACLPVSRAQVRHWKNNESLFRQAVAVTEGNYLAHNNLGVALAGNGRVDEAVQHFRKALAIKPDYAEAHFNLGLQMKSLGLADEAIAHYRKALAIKPDYAVARNNLGNELDDRGQSGEAVAEYRKALAIKPDYADAHFNLGVTLARLGQFDEAIAEYRKTLAIRPDYAQAHRELLATQTALQKRRAGR